MLSFISITILCFCFYRIYYSSIFCEYFSWSFSFAFDVVLIEQKIIVRYRNIDLSAFCHPGGWCSHNSCGSLFLVDGKGDDSWRAGDCDVTHVKGRSSRKVTVNQRGSFSLVDASSIHPLFPWFFPSDVFKSRRVYERIQLSIVAGHRPITVRGRRENLWLYATKCALIS